MVKDSDRSEDPRQEHYSFILFVVKDAVNSTRAHDNLKRLCKKWITGRYHIEIIDVLEDFQTALNYNILLTPSVVVKYPEPHITIHGDLSDSQSFIDALNLDQE